MEQLKQRIENKLVDGAIILLHDTQGITVELLPLLIKDTLKKGTNFGNLSKIVVNEI